MEITFENLKKLGFKPNQYGEMEIYKEEIHYGIRRISVTEMDEVYMEHSYDVPFNEDNSDAILCANCGTMEQLIQLCNIFLGLTLSS